jgi:uncharacterized protein
VALIELIHQGHSQAAFSLLEQNPDLAEETDSVGVSAALLALYHGHSELAEAILQRKSNLSVFEAAAFGKNAELEKFLETSSEHPWSADGYQPLHLAAYFGRTESTRLLLSYRAPLNELSRNQLGVAPLHSALSNGHEALARELIHEGAEVNLQNRTGWTSLHYAAHLGNRPLARFLIDHGAKKLKNADGLDPSEIAEKSGKTELLDLF